MFCKYLNVYSHFLKYISVMFVDSAGFDYDSCIARLRVKHVGVPEFKLRVWAKMLVVHFE